MQTVSRPEIVVDLDAYRHNVRTLRDLVVPADLMVVVKADAYGHGLLPCARAARAEGVAWLGVATVAEALALREAGDRGRVLCWLDAPGSDAVALVTADLDVGAYSLDDIDRLAAAAVELGAIARVHLKIDTGLARGGCAPADWPALVERAATLEAEGRLDVVGIWSHLASADDPNAAVNDHQERAFLEAVARAEMAGLTPQVRHLANSAAAVLRPSMRFDLVRCGIATYGLDPAPGHSPDLGLRPAMTVQAPLVMSKPLAAGEGVSYGHQWVAEVDTTVGLVPIGYAEGVLRSASNRGEVLVEGQRRPVRGRICMDQFVVDLGGDLPPPGTPVVVFGPGDHGEPTAQEWAEAAGTISYEIVTRAGGRLVRRHVGEGAELWT